MRVNTADDKVLWYNRQDDIKDSLWKFPLMSREHRHQAWRLVLQPYQPCQQPLQQDDLHLHCHSQIALLYVPNQKLWNALCFIAQCFTFSHIVSFL